MNNLRLAIVPLMLLAWMGCSLRNDSFEGIRAPTLGSSEAVSLETCRTAKCLTVYVAPWCPHCRAATPMILALRDYLKTRGVETRVIVGLDNMDAVRAYAQAFGQDTFLDAEGRIGPSGGVPAFFVSDASGRVLYQQNGAPEISPPFSDSILSQIAALYHVP
jgi:thiol-disulfide isomerase/thioredoxin